MLFKGLITALRVKWNAANSMRLQGKFSNPGLNALFSNVVLCVRLSLRTILTALNLWQDDVVTEAGNTVSFVFRTKAFGQETTQQRL